MHDPMQRNWKHAVPKRKKEKSPTITVIFRSVIIEGEALQSICSLKSLIKDEEDQNQDPGDAWAAFARCQLLSLVLILLKQWFFLFLVHVLWRSSLC